MYNWLQSNAFPFLVDVFGHLYEMKPDERPLPLEFLAFCMRSADPLEVADGKSYDSYKQLLTTRMESFHSSLGKIRKEDFADMQKQSMLDDLRQRKEALENEIKGLNEEISLLRESEKNFEEKLVAAKTDWENAVHDGQDARSELRRVKEELQKALIKIGQLSTA